MKEKKKLLLLSDLGLLAVAIIWGGGFIAVKTTLDTVTPFYMVVFRFSIGAILTCIVFFKKLKQIKKSDLAAGIFSGAMLYLGFALQTIGQQYTTVGKTAFLTAVYVVIVPFIFWIMGKKKPKIHNLVAALICLAGIGFLNLSGGKFAFGKGEALSLLCSVAFAAQIAALGIYSKKIDVIVLTILQLCTAAVLSLITAPIFEPFPKHMGAGSWIGILYLGVMSTFVAFLLQTAAQKYAAPSHSSLILCLESVFGTIMSVLFLKERLTLNMLLGCSLIFCSIIISEMFIYGKRRKKNKTLQQNEA